MRQLLARSKAQAAQSVSLRQRISAQLTRIIRSYVVIITSMLAVLTLLFGYYFRLDELSHHRELLATKFSTEVGNVANELQSLSTSTLLWTGLSDSQGRDGYLEPLLSRFNRSTLRQFFILDYRGRVFLAPEGAQLDTVLSSPAVVEAVAQGRDRYGMSRPGTGAPRFVLVQRIMSPQSDSPVGFIVGTIDAQQLVRQLDMGEDMKLSYAIGGEPLQPEPAPRELLQDRVDTIISPGDLNIPLSIWLAHPVLPSVLSGLLVILLAFMLGLWTLRRVSSWAQGFSASTTERLDQLVLSCQKVLAGEPLTLPPSPVRDEIAQVADALSTMLQQQKAATDELRTTSLVFSTAAEGILITDRQGVVVDVNPALTRMVGFSRDEMIGRLAGSLYRVPGRPEAPHDITRSLNQDGRWSGETTFVNRSGRAIATAVSVSRIVGEQGETLGHVAVITDVTRLKEAEHQLRELAYRDQLTQLPNFRMMGELVQQRLQTSGQPCLVLFLDLDRLKAVNDSDGHEAGDRMIKGMAQHLQRELPPGHLLCRRSGDEFIALLDAGLGEPGPDLLALLERLGKTQVQLPAGPSLVTATIGVARFPQDAQTWRELQVCADVAMNAAKQAQRGSVAWYDNRLGQKVLRQRQLHVKLEQAIEDDAIRVHYQPVVNLTDGTILGFEALARWTDPELGVVSPGEFIGVAEESHLSDQLTLQLLRIILRDKPVIQARFPGTVLAFNAAPRVFRDTRLINFMADRSEDDPDLLNDLEVELTETDIASSEGQLLRQLQVLTGMGVRLVIDDFGKGFSSLSRLAQYPISCLKIDASFVASLGLGRQTKIVELIVNLAQVLDLKVTAEGVETQAQREVLLNMGCTRGQGWLFARALPLEELLQLPPALAGIEAEAQA